MNRLLNCLKESKTIYSVALGIQGWNTQSRKNFTQSIASSSFKFNQLQLQLPKKKQEMDNLLSALTFFKHHLTQLSLYFTVDTCKPDIRQPSDVQSKLVTIINNNSKTLTKVKYANVSLCSVPQQLFDAISNASKLKYFRFYLTPLMMDYIIRTPFDKTIGKIQHLEIVYIQVMDWTTTESADIQAVLLEFCKIQYLQTLIFGADQFAHLVQTYIVPLLTELSNQIEEATILETFTRFSILADIKSQSRHDKSRAAQLQNTIWRLISVYEDLMSVRVNLHPFCEEVDSVLLARLSKCSFFLTDPVHY